MFYNSEKIFESYIHPLVSISPAMLQLRRKYLVSAVMTMRAESRISHGLLVVRSWLTDQSADVALISIVFVITCTYDD
jgi:hypothetical protein